MKTKEVFERRVLSVDTFKLNDLLGNVKGLVDDVNKTFIPVCLDNEVTPSTELLQKVMTDNNAVNDLFAGKIDKDIVGLAASGKLMKSSLLQAAKPSIEAIEKAVAKLKHSDRYYSHYIAMAGYGGMNVYPHIEIVEGKAAISEAAKLQFEAQFTNAIETPRQQEAFDILANIAKEIETVRTLTKEANGYFELAIDPVFFQLDLMDTVEVNPNIIKYF